jgi:hypothetical protein
VVAVLVQPEPCRKERILDLNQDLVRTSWYAWLSICAITGAATWVAGGVGLSVFGSRALVRRYSRWRDRKLPPELRMSDPDLSEHKTIGDIMLGLGLTPHKHFTWAIGSQVRDMYESRYGTPPRKALRKKATGKGSHDFAVYPPMLVPDIEKIILAYMAAPPPLDSQKAVTDDEEVQAGDGTVGDTAIEDAAVGGGADATPIPPLPPLGELSPVAVSGIQPTGHGMRGAVESRP